MLPGSMLQQPHPVCRAPRPWPRRRRRQLRAREPALLASRCPAPSGWRAGRRSCPRFHRLTQPCVMGCRGWSGCWSSRMLRRKVTDHAAQTPRPIPLPGQTHRPALNSHLVAARAEFEPSELIEALRLTNTQHDWAGRLCSAEDVQHVEAALSPDQCALRCNTRCRQVVASGTRRWHSAAS